MRKKTLLSHHYHHFEGSSSRLRWTLFYLAFGPQLEAITYPTRFTRDEALKIAPWLRSKTNVVRNGFAVRYETEEKRLEGQREARLALGLPSDAFLVGNAGWWIKRKRFDVFLRTAQLVSRRIPDARFVICGGGQEEVALRRLAQELGLANKVIFQGWVDDLSIYYRAWDALLFNTDFDTLPCTPMEAASYGCVCVASSLYGGLPEFLEHGQSGFLFRQHDAEKLAEALAQVARDPSLALRLRRAAVRVLDKEFSLEKGLQFYEEYFHTDQH
jgi:glycosyltransferase involved in cell wall biosynthesis